MSENVAIKKIVIPGNPGIKKNAGRMVNARGRRFRVPSERYMIWERTAKQILMTWPEPPVEVPFILKCSFFVPDNRARDLSNLYEGIQDVLKTMRVIKDDAWQYLAGHDGSRVYIDKENPRTEVEIILI